MLLKEAILKLLRDIKADITGQQYGMGMVASGMSAASLEEVATDREGTLLGDKSFYFQEFGRSPGRRPPSDSILKWIQDKRITVPNNWTIEGFAYVIARKIGREGSSIFRGKAGLPVTQIIDDNVSNFTIDETEITDKIYTLLKNAF